MTEPIKNTHVPVLLEPILEFLKTGKTSNPEVNLNVFDGTLGGGGYTTKLLELGYSVYACDLDQKAIKDFYSIHTNTKNLVTKNLNFAEYITEFADNYFGAIILDLGFSSNQLEYSDRGFSYLKDGEELDLRYNLSTGKACFELLQNLDTPDKLWTILYTFSGESLSRPIAKAIYNFLKLSNRSTIFVKDFREEVIKSIPKKYLKHKNAILSRVWQALRIYTNQEFESLEKFLQFAYQKLQINGILCIVSFHSLEDKIVTKSMRSLSKPLVVDDYGNRLQYYSLLTPKAVVPAETEITENPRSRSAMLRVLQKLI